MDETDQAIISALWHDARASLSDLAVQLGVSRTILRQQAGLSAVRASHTTNGRRDIIAEIGAPTLEELDRVLSKIRRMERVVSIETRLLRSTRKYEG